MSLVRLVLTFESSPLELFVDVNEPVEVLRFQIFSLTEVAPEDQVVSGSFGLLDDNRPLSALQLVDGQPLTLTRRGSANSALASAPPVNMEQFLRQFAAVMSQPQQAQPPQAHQPVQLGKKSSNLVIELVERLHVRVRLYLLTDWQSGCSRIFVGEQPFVQPSFIVQKGVCMREMC